MFLLRYLDRWSTIPVCRVGSVSRRACYSSGGGPVVIYAEVKHRGRRQAPTNQQQHTATSSPSSAASPGPHPAGVSGAAAAATNYNCTDADSDDEGPGVPPKLDTTQLTDDQQPPVIPLLLDLHNMHNMHKHIMLCASWLAAQRAQRSNVSKRSFSALTLLVFNA